jgi:anti-sigma regulatory factor (Ser/Thr protein kinase)
MASQPCHLAAVRCSHDLSKSFRSLAQNSLRADVSRLALLGIQHNMDPFRAVVADSSELRSLRRRFGDWLRLGGVDDGTLDGLILAVHEAAANGTQHGTAADSVSVNAELVEGVVTIEVTDYGRWREPRLNGPDTDERGRGLAIIRALVNEVTIEAISTGTTVRLLQRVV